jgi:SAM-dependent methyltransferase
MAHERIIELYETNAAAWDRMRGRDLHERSWLDRFAAEIPGGGTILDIGCGMGEPVARYLIERGFKVTGVDSSPSLIAMARERFPDQEWLVADMRDLALGRRFDGVIAWHSSFHLSPDDQRRMFPIFASHCAPGGALMFTSGPEHGESIGQWLGEPLYHGSLDPAEYRTLLDSNDLKVIANEVRDPDCGSSTVWLARKDQAAQA